MCDIENIPAKMKEHNIFCCWKEEKGNGKKTKVPYNVKIGSRASSNDLSPFSSYGEAVKVMHDYTGIGFIVSHDICAIDLDECINEGGELNEIAQNVIAFFPNCYIEKSLSGSGLHIYFKTANFDYDTDIYYINNRKLNIEVYIARVTKRFPTITGDVFQDGILEDMTDTLPQFLEVFMMRLSTVTPNDVDESISYLSDESVIEKANKSVNGEKFKKLWNGDIPSYESRSEADLALASILAFWCGRNIEQMDRLFRKSRLMRNKWDRKQSGTTYGQITLETARRNVFTTYKPYGINSASNDFSDDKLERLNDMQPFKNNHYACTDIGNSNLFADYYKSVARYIPERKKWFIYNKQAWESNTGNLKVM
ncbi:phage NrS-1 polymerase family protein [Aerococcus urinaeequi]